MEEENNQQERLCFIRQGDNGMQVEIVGNGHTLMSMVHSALMTHAEIRKLLIPVFTELMKDEKFLLNALGDALSSIDDDDEEIIDTE